MNCFASRLRACHQTPDAAAPVAGEPAHRQLPGSKRHSAETMWPQHGVHACHHVADAAAPVAGEHAHRHQRGALGDAHGAPHSHRADVRTVAVAVCGVRRAAQPRCQVAPEVTGGLSLEVPANKRRTRRLQGSA